MAYQGIGNKVTTTSPTCLPWMNRGVMNSFGFRREEAIRCFKKALEIDSNCPMAYYFIAYNYAADYNNPDGMDYGEGYKQAQKAQELALNSASITDWEQALIEAQLHRFCWPVCSKPLEEMHKNYADAMRPVYQKFGEYVDIAAIYAESLLMLSPWTLWTKPPVIRPALQETEELMSVLEKALEKDPVHPGLCHYYIHTMELSPTPEKALPAADVLRSQYPEQGHLLHMPSHIDMWVGQYKEAVEINKIAVLSDEAYKEKRELDVEMYDMYRMHNYHFTVWAAMFDGQFATALHYAEVAEQQLGAGLVSSMIDGAPFGSIYLEPFATLPWHVLIRFGKWQEIIDRPVKKDTDLYASTIAASHYARAIAFAVLGKLEEADSERSKFQFALKSKALEGRYLFNNLMHDPSQHNGILDVAEAVMNGEVEYHKGNFEKAFEYLRLAVERDINLIYDEPWGWMIPARHVLGALLLEHKEVGEAEEVYREDLKQYKNNLWSLLGLCQALKQQGKGEEAESVHSLFQKARARADITIGASCLCAIKLCDC